MSQFAVESNNLSVHFNDFIALDNINLSIPSGTFAAIVGPNGSGKTTFLKLLLNIIKPTIGEIKIFGQDRKNVKPGLIGYVPQIKTIDRSFPATALELVLSGINNKWVSIKSKGDVKKSLEALDLVGANGLAKQQISSLSGGQLQRVYLARSFVAQPQILLLDEPATGIDLVCETSLNSIIDEYNRKNNATVIMVTHDWSAAYHHTKHVLLLNKKQIFFGSPEKAFTDINLQRTFSHLGHNHNVTFGLINNA